MDPLSFTASLLAVIKAAHIGEQSLRKLYGYRNAPQDLERLRVELEGVGSLLENVRQFVGENSPDLHYGILTPPIDAASGKIDSVNKILSSPAFRLHNLSDANKARLTWVRYKHRLEGLRQEIKDSSADLGVRLGFVAA